MKKRRIPAAAVIALAGVSAAGCTVKRESLRREEQVVFSAQRLRKDSSQTDAQIRIAHGAQIRIDETCIEKDTAGHIVRQIRRQYIIERKDSTEKTVSTRSAATAENYRCATEQRRESTASVREPSTRRLFPILVGIVLLVVAGAGLFRRMVRR